MHPIDRYLVRLPRQEPSPDFVDRLFDRLHASQASIPRPSGMLGLRERWREWTHDLAAQPRAEPAGADIREMPGAMWQRVSVPRHTANTCPNRHPVFPFSTSSLLYFRTRKEALS